MKSLIIRITTLEKIGTVLALGEWVSEVSPQDPFLCMFNIQGFQLQSSRATAQQVFSGSLLEHT